MLFADIPGDTEWTRELQNTAHTPAFALLAWLIWAVVLAQPRPPAHPPAVAFGVCVLFAGGTEVLQHVLGRDVSVCDILRDLLGAGAMALGLAAISAGQKARRRRKALLLSASAVTALVALAPLGWTTAAYVHRYQRFPVLAEFRSALDVYFVDLKGTTKRPTLTAVDGGSALIVPLIAHEWPGVELREPFPDWHGFKRLHLKLSNPSKHDLRLTLRVHDKQHTMLFEDRLNVPIHVPAHATIEWHIGLDEIERAPRGRLMNLRQIANLQLFTEGPEPAGAFLLERIWLE